MPCQRRPDPPRQRWIHNACAASPNHERGGRCFAGRSEDSTSVFSRSMHGYLLGEFEVVQDQRSIRHRVDTGCDAFVQQSAKTGQPTSVLPPSIPRAWRQTVALERQPLTRAACRVSQNAILNRLTTAAKLHGGGDPLNRTAACRRHTMCDHSSSPHVDHGPPIWHSTHFRMCVRWFAVCKKTLATTKVRADLGRWMEQP